MKKYILLIISIIIVANIAAQDQTISGNLTASGNISVGKDISSKWGEGMRLYLRGTDSSNDPIWLAKYTLRQEITDLRINIGDNPDTGDRLVVGTTHWSTQHFHEWFIVRSDGNVGIGVASPASKLDVNGKIKATTLDIAGTINAREVNITVDAGADFVFEPDYNLKPLSELESFVKENKHLPEIPSEKQMREDGLNINDMQIKLLQKIEELTLYVITQDKRIKALEEENHTLKSR
ncbi:MAG: hypothetical protein LBS20_01320 [Prevotella sp.]|jgi:hypothetical protein|nr:hypothetical protein [Prevotella sp.]